jgi:hypothetical protein
MQFLQTTLNEQSEIHWVTHYHDNADNTNWDNTLSIKMSQVVLDPGKCIMTYHYKILRDGTMISDKDLSFNFHDVQDMMLTTGDLRQNKNDIAAGHTTWVAKVDPPLFDLIATTGNHTEFYFIFTSEDVANRATKAMGHAVDLCGGSRGSF